MESKITEVLSTTNAVAIDKAVALLKQGEVVVLPTDTIYGIAASITTQSGVEKIYDVKSRDPAKPIMIYVTHVEQLQHLAEGITAKTIGALKRIWPGAMSGIFIKKGNSVPNYVTSGKNTIAVRIPDHPLCLELVNQLGHPMAITSANISGMQTHKTAQDVAKQLGPRVPLVLDGGMSQQDAPSTLVDFTGSTPKLLREGVLSFAQLQYFLPELQKASETEMLHAMQ